MKIFIIIISSLLLFALPVFALPSAQEKRLDSMFELLAQDSDMVFIRNGEEYGAAEAVAHLQRKLTFAARFLDTAEEFIDRAATKSSISGEPYLIRSKIDNSTVGAAPYLKALLKKADEGVGGKLF